MACLRLISCIHAYIPLLLPCPINVLGLMLKPRPPAPYPSQTVRDAHAAPRWATQPTLPRLKRFSRRSSRSVAPARCGYGPSSVVREVTCAVKAKPPLLTEIPNLRSIPSQGRGSLYDSDINPHLTPSSASPSQGRGSLYDSRVGICCHFCRQKKLCGEPDCPRCQTRNADEDCIGEQ